MPGRNTRAIVSGKLAAGKKFASRNHYEMARGTKFFHTDLGFKTWNSLSLFNGLFPGLCFFSLVLLSRTVLCFIAWLEQKSLSFYPEGLASAFLPSLLLRMVLFHRCQLLFALEAH